MMHSLLCRVPRLMLWGMAVAVLGLGGLSAQAQEKKGLIGSIDLMTKKGVEEVKGEWKYHDVTTGVGKDKNEIEPKAHGTFDDAKWETMEPEKLSGAKGAGAYCWCWYRIKVTIPDMVNGKKFEGGPVWFQTKVDDYGEIWVDGDIDRAFGSSGKGAVSGFNALNRVRLQKVDKVDDKGKKIMRDAKPGDVFQIAVLGINSPLGNPPGNKIFLHKGSTKLDFYEKGAPKDGAIDPLKADGPKGKVGAKVDLMTKAGADLLQGVWKRHPVDVHVGQNKNEIAPKAHGKFDDSKWEVVEDPKDLAAAKAFGPGKFSMYWCRIKITIPEKVDGKEVAGKAVWFKTTVDDYGEVWVDGKLDTAYGKSGAGAISGFNTPNYVKLTEKAQPGQTIQLAILAINSPFGNPPGNKIFFRNAEVHFIDAP
jgi:hypothetical protein